MNLLFVFHAYTVAIRLLSYKSFASFLPVALFVWPMTICICASPSRFPFHSCIHFSCHFFTPLWLSQLYPYIWYWIPIGLKMGFACKCNLYTHTHSNLQTHVIRTIRCVASFSESGKINRINWRCTDEKIAIFLLTTIYEQLQIVQCACECLFVHSDTSMSVLKDSVSFFEKKITPKTPECNRDSEINSNAFRNFMCEMKFRSVSFFLHFQT